MTTIGSELRKLRKEIVRLHRRHALSDIEGTVTEVDTAGSAIKVKAEIGEDPETGRKIYTPFIRFQSNAVGTMQIVSRPKVGMRIRVASPSGVIGTASTARHVPFDDETPHPLGEADHVITDGTARIEFKGGEILVKSASKVTVEVGETSIVALPEKATVKSAEIVTDGKTRVGSPDAARKIHYVDGKDTGGDLAVDGSDAAFV